MENINLPLTVKNTLKEAQVMICRCEKKNNKALQKFITKIRSSKVI